MTAAGGGASKDPRQGVPIATGADSGPVRGLPGRLLAFTRAQIKEYSLNGSMWHDNCDTSDVYSGGCQCEVSKFVGGDVQSKLAILDLCEHWLKQPGSEVADEMLLVLRWLAVAHADHPDYREAWRP